MHGRIIGENGEAVNGIDTDAKWFYKRTGINEIWKITTKSGRTAYVPIMNYNKDSMKNLKLLAASLRLM